MNEKSLDTLRDLWDTIKRTIYTSWELQKVKRGQKSYFKNNGWKNLPQIYEKKKTYRSRDPKNVKLD